MPKYLNVGCGSKYNTNSLWENIDMNAKSNNVKKHDLTKGLPYADNKFDAVYHSQVLEHIPKEKAKSFIEECYRVLKVGGVIRVVVPDLENIVHHYQKFLSENLKNPTPESKANYDWIMLEMYDQTVRDKPGGLMMEYLKKPKIENQKFMDSRMGYVGISMRKNRFKPKNTGLLNKIKAKISDKGLMGFLILVLKKIQKKLFFILTKEKYEVGKFRLSGEIHYWMYDRFSLSELLKSVGFKKIKVQNPYDSYIKDWEKHELDVRDGLVYDPSSLFIEAVK